MAYFPEDLLRDIFGRLPLNSLVRFKSLTKQWPSLYPDQNFINSQHLGQIKELYGVSYLKNLYGLPYAYPMYRLRIESDYDKKSFKAVPVEFPDPRALESISSLFHCNGILCLLYGGLVSTGSILFWNPLTKQHKKITYPPNQGDFKPCGFGYDSADDDYKIVFIEVSYQVQILSMKTGKWNTASNTVSYKFTLSYGGGEGVTVDRCLYWMARADSSKMAVILCFDFETNTLREETCLCEEDLLCKYDDYFSDTESTLGAFEERLCLASTFDYKNTEVWIMKENKVNKTKSWIKLFTIPQIGMSYSQDPWPVLPVALFKNGKILVKMSYLLFLFDPADGNKPTRIEIHGLQNQYFVNSISYEGSLSW